MDYYYCADDDDDVDFRQIFDFIIPASVLRVLYDSI